MSAELGPVVQAWIDRFRAERPMNHGALGTDPWRSHDGLFIGAVAYIEEQSGVSTREVWKIVHQEYRTVSLPLADRVLVAIGLEHMIDTGEITVVPNPMWTNERYREYMRERGAWCD
jgi:hypothetical protein